MLWHLQFFVDKAWLVCVSWCVNEEVAFGTFDLLRLNFCLSCVCPYGDFLANEQIRVFGGWRWNSCRIIALKRTFRWDGYKEIL